MTSHYDYDGNPMSFEEWAVTFEDTAARIVAKTTISGKFVSTVWLGLDHRFSGDGPPLIFETMIFPADDNDEIDDFGEEYCERYATKEEAVRGHWRAVEMVMGPEPDEETLQEAIASVRHLISSLEKSD